jgi:hypothetical protein
MNWETSGTGNLAYAQDGGTGICDTLYPIDVNIPSLGGCGQFVFGRLALWEQTKAAGTDKRGGKCQQIAQRSQRAGADDVGREGSDLLDSFCVDRDGSSGRPRNLPQECRLALIALDQVNLWHPKDREDEAGKTGAASEIDKDAGCRGDQRHKLCRIDEVAIPQIVERPGADQIDRALPFPQQIRVNVQTFACFT